MATHSGTLAWRFHGWRSLVGYTVHGVAKSRTRLNDFPFFLSIVPFGEGNGNPLLCSCWRIPWTEGPGGLQSIGLQRVGPD